MSGPIWLRPRASEVNDHDMVYSLAEAKRNFTVIPLLSSGYLVVHEEEELIVRFAVFYFSYSVCGQDESTMLNLIFHGEGPSGSLRECRHTYWGAEGEGYLFYPDGRVIAAAFKELSKYFNEMAVD